MALRFEANYAGGDDSYASTSTISVSDHPFTWHCMAKAIDVDASGSPHFWWMGDVSIGNNYVALIFRNTAGTLQLELQDRFDNSPTVLLTSNNWSWDTWHSVCGVWTSTTDRRVILDGDWANSTQEAVTTVDIFVGTVDGMAFARLNDSSPFRAEDCVIAEPGQWNVALTQGEIEALSRGVSPLLIRPESLVNYWPVHGNTTTEPDLVSKATLTLTNVPVKADHPPILRPTAQILQFPPAPTVVNTSIIVPTGPRR